MTKKIYRLNIEVKKSKDDSLPDDCGGAFVNVYVPASSILEAIELAEKELRDDSFWPVETISANQLEEYEFEAEEYEQGDPAPTDLKNILEAGGKWYAAFNSYPKEQDAVH